MRIKHSKDETQGKIVCPPRLQLLSFANFIEYISQLYTTTLGLRPHRVSPGKLCRPVGWVTLAHELASNPCTSFAEPLVRVNASYERARVCTTRVTNVCPFAKSGINACCFFSTEQSVAEKRDEEENWWGISKNGGCCGNTAEVCALCTYIYMRNKICVFI